jgi:hypothetical protein
MSTISATSLTRRQALQAGLAVAGTMTVAGSLQAQNPPLRAGIIGLDTSHVVAFTRILNNPNNQGDLAGVRVVAGYPGGSPDIPASKDRIDGFTRTLREQLQVEIVPSIEELLKKVDVVLLESVDGRPHLAQARPVFAARKPVFIDKPVAGSLADAIQIYNLARETRTPCFSSSSLRFAPAVQEIRATPNKVGEILGCESYGSCPTEPHHPDLFWYGIHGVEILFTIMGAGCESVVRIHTRDTDKVVGVWNNGRIGSFRGIRAGRADYGATVFGRTAISPVSGSGGYEPLVREIARFFKTGQAPVPPEETVNMFAFMEAADESKRQSGRPVAIADVMARARGS